MKPKVFLSHSSKDKPFITKLANDLRVAQIDVWVDDWEIPPGESIRRKIFEDGIPNCDLFFVYLSENSIESYWVQRELDSAVLHEANIKNSFLALFVDKEDNRSSLSIDLQSTSIPVLNDECYHEPVIKLISRTWQSKVNDAIAESAKEKRILELEKNNEILKLRSEIVQLRIEGTNSPSTTVKRLKKTEIKIDGEVVSLYHVFNEIKYALASGTTDR